MSRDVDACPSCGDILIPDRNDIVYCAACGITVSWRCECEPGSGMCRRCRIIRQAEQAAG